MNEKKYDLIIKNLKVVKPQSENIEEKDIAIKDGKFAAIESNIDPEHSNEIYDGKGKLAFPGLVDAHMHTGIYNPLDKDAVIESRAAAMGGVTSSLNYMRTGGYYLIKVVHTEISCLRFLNSQMIIFMLTMHIIWPQWIKNISQRSRNSLRISE